MPLDHYVTLGRSGLAVSPFCLGAMTFGEDWGWGSTVKESEAIVDLYVGRGGNFIDTANAYTRGHSEKSKPTLNFPADFVRGSGMFKRGGTTVNGATAPPWPLAPKTNAERH